MKLVFVLALGIAVGYSYGFKDARAHEENIVTRTVERIGGSNRDRVKTDVDREMERVEKR